MVYRPWQSHIPDALDALVRLTKQQVALAGADVVVHDSAFVGGGTQANVIMIGWAGFQPGYEYPTRVMSEETGNAAVAGEGAQTGLSGVQETFTISCASLVRAGSTDPAEISATRRIAYQNLRYVGQALDTPPPHLGGTVANAVMGTSQSYFPVQDRRGLLSVVTFGIRCESWAQQ